MPSVAAGQVRRHHRITVIRATAGVGPSRRKQRPGLGQRQGNPAQWHSFHGPRYKEGVQPADLGAGERDRTANLPFTRVRSQAAHTLAAPMAPAIALMASAALGLFGASSHEPFHADGGQSPWP